MRVIICGGRDFTNRQFLFQKLNQFHASTPITGVIEGGARGADKLGRWWAETNRIPITTIEAQWTRYGKKAGWIRNNEMADQKPDAIIAFKGGIGTQMMIDIAKKRGIKVYKPIVD